MDAHAAGLERARQAGRDLTGIHSVASFFVSRVDTEVDHRLDAIGTPEAGARPQRPLWASTGVKDPAYPDTMYVSELAIPGTVNTMPGTTLAAYADHGTLADSTPVADNYAAAQEHFAALERVGVDFTDVTDTLEHEGLAKFETSWAELSASVGHEMGMAAESRAAG
jgi:transaldolase